MNNYRYWQFMIDIMLNDMFENWFRDLKDEVVSENKK